MKDKSAGDRERIYTESERDGKKTTTTSQNENDTEWDDEKRNKSKNMY